MIKIARQITHLFFLFAVIACSHQPITSPDEEATITKNKPVLPKAPSQNQEPKTQQAPEQRVKKSNPTPIDKNKAKTHPAKQTPSDKTLSNKELKAEQFLIATPKKDPTLSEQSSKHTNELKPEKQKREKPLEDKHQVPSPSQGSDEQAKTEQQKSESNQRKNQDIRKSSNKDKQDHDGQSTKQKAKNELEKTNKNVAGNKTDIKSEDNHNNQSSTILSKTEPMHDEKGTHVNGHEGHTHEDHDYHHDGHIDADHEHTPKKNKAQHWNMQRIIKPKTIE